MPDFERNEDGYITYDESHENTPEMREVFNQIGYVRPLYYDLANPSITEDEARAAMETLDSEMREKGIPYKLSLVNIANRHFLAVLVEDRLEKEQAPDAYIDGVYVAIERVDSLNPNICMDRP